MHGLQHILRQHAVEKQSSVDSWHSAQSALSSQLHLQQHYGASPNARMNDVRSLSSDSSESLFNQGKTFFIKLIYFLFFFLIFVFLFVNAFP